MFVRGSDLPEVVTAHGPDVPVRKKVFVPRGVIPHIMQLATSVSIGPCDLSVDLHTHNTMWEIWFVLEGHATFHIGDETHPVGPGDLVAAPPNTFHPYRVETDEVLKLFYMGVATDE